MTRTLVSIGLPVYNGFPYLPAALESLLAQDYLKLELVISDNGSTDETASYCQELARRDPRVRYVRNSTNIGPMANFRQAVELARGEYFVWGADDDLWSPNYISTLVAQLEQHPQALLATPAFQPIRHDGSPLGRLRAALHPRSKPAQVWQLFWTRAATWLYGVYRREALRPWSDRWQGSFYGDFDFVWLLELLLTEQVVGDNRAVLYKRHNRGRAARSGSLRNRAAAWSQVFREATRVCREAPQPAAVRLGCCAAVWTAYSLRVARYLLISGPRDALKRAIGWKRRPSMPPAEFFGAEQAQAAEQAAARRAA